MLACSLPVSFNGYHDLFERQNVKRNPVGGSRKPFMPNRHYACSSCGSLKRSAKIYRRDQEDGPSWPHCCNQPMKLLSFVQSEAATQISDAERVEWLVKGGHVLDRGGKHRWKPVTADWQIDESKRQVAAYDRNAKKKFHPPE